MRYVREAKSVGGAALFGDATGTATHIDATTREDGYVQRGSTIEKAVLRYFIHGRRVLTQAGCRGVDGRRQGVFT